MYLSSYLLVGNLSLPLFTTQTLTPRSPRIYSELVKDVQLEAAVHCPIGPSHVDDNLLTWHCSLRGWNTKIYAHLEILKKLQYN